MAGIEREVRFPKVRRNTRRAGRECSESIREKAIKGERSPGPDKHRAGFPARGAADSHVPVGRPRGVEDPAGEVRIRSGVRLKPLVEGARFRSKVQAGFDHRGLCGNRFRRDLHGDRDHVIGHDVLFPHAQIRVFVFDPVRARGGNRVI